MATILCGDLHGRINVAKKVLEHTHEDIVFVGDYVDSFTKTTSDQIALLELLLEARKNEPDRITLLMGNHELSYLSPQDRCSGWNYLMQSYIDSKIEEISEALQLVHIIDNHVISHAGISKTWLPESVSSIEELVEFLKTADEDKLTEVSRIRGGTARCGGPLWCDNVEFVPLDFCSQIFGHTEYRSKKETYGIFELTPGNWNIDALSHSEQVLVLDDNGETSIMVL